jgi:hypothetical protein
METAPAIGTKRGINHVCFATAGLLMATADVTMRLRVYANDEILWERDLGSPDDRRRSIQRIRSATFSEDASRLYVAAGDTLAAFDAMSGEPLWEYVPPPTFGFLVTSPTAVSSTGTGLHQPSAGIDMQEAQVAGTFDNAMIGVWSADGELRAMWYDNDAPRRIAFLQDGRTLLGTDSFSLCVWDVVERKRLCKRRLTDRVYGFASSPALPYAATRTLHSLQLWDLANDRVGATVPVGVGLPVMAFHPTLPLLAFGERHGVSVADFDGNIVATREVHTASVMSVAFHPQGDDVYLGCSDDSIRRWSFA